MQEYEAVDPNELPLVKVTPPLSGSVNTSQVMTAGEMMCQIFFYWGRGWEGGLLGIHVK